MNSFEDSDLMFIASELYPNLPKTILQKMITFNHELFRATMIDRKYGTNGSPWEFNLRDILRWCQLLNDDLNEQNATHSKLVEPENYLDLMYLQRMRTDVDKNQVRQLFEQVFGVSTGDPEATTRPYYSVTPRQIQIGRSVLPRKGNSNPNKEDLLLLQSFLSPLESLLKV